MNYAKGLQEVEFVSGYELIQNIKTMLDSETIGTAYPLPATTAWRFMGDDVNSTDLKDIANQTGGAGFDGEIELKAHNEAANEYAYASYYTDVTGGLGQATHISLDYNINSAIKVRLYVEGDNTAEGYAAPWEVTLNNINKDVHSGKIPFSAFAYGPYSLGSATSLDASKVNRIEIAPAVAGTKTAIKVSNITTYGGAISTPVAKGIFAPKSALSVQSIHNGTMNLNVPTAGQYSVALYTTNGRLVKSLSNSDMTAGINAIDIANLSTGVYMLNVVGQNGVKLSTKALIK